MGNHRSGAVPAEVKEIVRSEKKEENQTAA